MKVSAELVAKLEKLATSMYEEDCRKEFPNPNPLYVEVGPKRLTLQEQIQRCLHTELSREAYDQGMETFEESIDFDVDEDGPPIMSGHEFEIMDEENLEEARQALEAQKKADKEEAAKLADDALTAKIEKIVDEKSLAGREPAEEK